MIKFAVAAKQYFGLKPGQHLSQFAAELRELTPDDQREIAEGLSAILGEPVEI